MVERARAYVAAHPRARFHGTATVEGGTIRTTTGSAQTAHADVAGELAMGRAHAVIADSQLTSEVVLDGDTVYAREAATTDALAKASYVRADTQLRRVMRVRAEQAKALDVAAVFAAAQDLKTLGRHGGVTTLDGDVDVPRLFGSKLAQHVEWATLKAVVADDGRPVSTALVVRAEADLTTRLSFDAWGDAAITVAAPPPAQVDARPSVTQLKLASLRSTKLVMPKQLPDGWQLVGTDVLAPSETEEGCTQAALSYEDQTNPDAGYLYLYEFPSSCAQPPEGSSSLFNAGPYGGFSSETADGPYVQITVGNTTVQAVSDLALPDLAGVLSDLVPLVVQSS